MCIQNHRQREAVGTARSVNAVMTAAYWLIGQHIVEFEQAREESAPNTGAALIKSFVR